MKNNRHIKIFGFVLMIIFSILLLEDGLFLLAVENAGNEEKVFSQATINDDFADDRVIIVFNETETKNFKAYTKNDFSDVNCISVENLTKYTEEIVKKS